MLAHLEDTAQAAGAEVMVLETGARQPEAIALYESSGYLPIPGFGFYKDSPISRCMARSLLLAGGSGRTRGPEGSAPARPACAPGRS